MSVTTQIRFDTRFKYPPERLLEVSQRVPLTPDRFIPVGSFLPEFALTPSTVQTCGNGAVRLSMDGEPFGFIKSTIVGLRYGEPIRSPLTKDIILAPVEGAPDEWEGVFETPDPLTVDDLTLMARGVEIYADLAGKKIAERTASGLIIAKSATRLPPLPPQALPFDQPH
jgi:hypothetical protein